MEKEIFGEGKTSITPIPEMSYATPGEEGVETDTDMSPTKLGLQKGKKGKSKNKKP